MVIISLTEQMALCLKLFFIFAYKKMQKKNKPTKTKKKTERFEQPNTIFSNILHINVHVN